MTIRVASSLSLLCVLAIYRPVWAQDEPSPRERFERGLDLFEEGRYDAALAELSRAHELTPSPVTAFNIARIHAIRGESVEAVRILEGLQAEPRLSGAQREELETLLREHRARVGRLRVDVRPDGATIVVDGQEVGRAPLTSSVLLSVGEHEIVLSAPGHEQLRRRVTLAGAVERHLVEELRPAAGGSIRVASALPGVEVVVDGEIVGRTPLAATIPVRPGPHRLIARRVGYSTLERTLRIDSGAEVELDVGLPRDPAGSGPTGELVLEVPPTSAIEIDGAPARARERLPVGPHRVVVTTPDREPHEEVVEVPVGGASLRVEPRWTAEARAARLRDAEALRVGGGAAVAIGGALLVAGVVIALYNEPRWPDAEAERRALEECQTRAAGVPIDTVCPGWQDRADAYNAQQDEILALRVAEAIGMGLGAIAAAVGIGLLVGAPSDDEPGLAVRVGPTGVAVLGTLP